MDKIGDELTFVAAAAARFDFRLFFGLGGAGAATGCVGAIGLALLIELKVAISWLASSNVAPVGVELIPNGFGVS